MNVVLYQRQSTEGPETWNNCRNIIFSSFFINLDFCLSAGKFEG